MNSQAIDILYSLHILKLPDVFTVCRHLLFFFSSRRRHTRFDCDWSSDVCSSDLSSAGENEFAAANSFSPALDLHAVIGRVLQAEHFEVGRVEPLTGRHQQEDLTDRKSVV